MAKKTYETEDGSRIAPLSELRDFQVAEGYPDIRGWRVDAADGTRVGKVQELLVDVDTMRTRYLDVRLTAEIAAAPGDRDVLVPIGAARIQEKGDVVVVPLPTDRVGLLPPYSHGRLTRAHEYEVRRHFSLGEAAAAAAGGSAGGATAGESAGATTAGASPSREFYDHDGYDDRRFFSTRRPSAEEAPARLPEAQHAADSDESEIRLPVQRDDSVVLKRGPDGRDEIIIRRPRGGEDVAR